MLFCVNPFNKYVRIYVHSYIAFLNDKIYDDPLVYGMLLDLYLGSVAARVYFSTYPYRAYENIGQIQITLYLSYSLSTTIRVQILTEDHTAFVSG